MAILIVLKRRDALEKFIILTSFSQHTVAESTHIPSSQVSPTIIRFITSHHGLYRH